MGTATATAPAIHAIITLDRASKTPLYVQLGDAIRNSIERGDWPIGSALPRLKSLAAELTISDSTVRRAFQKLASEGRLAGSAASGFTVIAVAAPADRQSPVKKRSSGSSRRSQARRQVSSLPAPAQKLAITQPAVEPESKPASPTRAVVSFNRSAVAAQIDASRLQATGPLRPFRAGFPETQEFPLDIWEGLRSRLLKEKSNELLDFCGAFGHFPLREAIAARLGAARGVRCSPEQVIVCAGAQQALNLVINTLISPGDLVGMEEPGYYGAKAAFQQAGARITPLLVDEEGLNVPDSRRQNAPALLYTTPTNQFPLGAALSLPRRLALLEFARQTGAWVLEDDCDGDFCYSGRPLPSLQGTDNYHRVIYLGSTGRTLFSSLEIGYLVVPLSLMETFSKVKEIMGGQPCVIDQATLASFLSEGHFDRHVRRMNVLYYQRLQALADSVQSELSGFIDLEPTQGGLHAVGWLARGLEEERVTSSAAQAGIELPLLSTFGKTALVRPGVVFGFAAFSEKIIRQTVKSLGEILRGPQMPKALPPVGGIENVKRGFFQRIFAKREG
jgi:GntR family transcriptional regulator/MocR family aminotransferase